MTKGNIVLLGVGDIGPVHEPMETYSTLIRPILATGDIRFGQCERTYSDSGMDVEGLAVDPKFVQGLRPHRGSRPLKPSMISVFSDAGFNIVSMAGNHTMDYGGVPVLDTIAHFNKRGIQVIGAGANLQEARRPAIIEKNGVKVAMLAYCSVVIEGYAAGPNKPGVAPLRARTSYVATEYQPGMLPRIITTLYEEDLAGMLEDIAKAKQEADVVVVSMHWGIHMVPRMIAGYQTVAAEAAFKAGADLILGHHAHVPKAIENKNGKVCFYSLGNFIFSTETRNKAGFAEFMKHVGVVPDLEDAPHCPHGKDSKHSLIAKAVLTREGVKKVSFLPVEIDKQLRPEVLNRGDPRFDTVVKFMDWVSEDYEHTFAVEGDEVVIKN